ncbi:MAG: hypothetical protein LBU82_06580, partial [Treponema sp.]|nr:hypothetical protein [Treponema sp.]
MQLKEMYVMAAGAPIDGKGGKPVLPYQFSAQENKNGGYKRVVRIVMPVGGSHSGLFRYPKEGEKVLVGVEESGYSYLMGYLPEDSSKADGVYTGGANHKSVLPSEMAGQFFRYKAPYDDTAETEYSEIGFYSEPSPYPENAKSQEKGIPPREKNARMNIRSSWDLHEEAENHLRAKAARMEMLADCGGVEYEKDELGKFKTDKVRRPFDDQAGDDSELHEGDIHLRAANRVVIKAGDTIQIRVGRSIIELTDSGISVTSRKTDSNMPGSMDSAISVVPQSGVSITGHEVSMNGYYGVKASDGFGGSVASDTGIFRIGAADIKLATISDKAFFGLLVKNTIDLAANTVTTIAGAAGAGAGGDAGMLSSSATMALDSAMAIYDFMRRYFIKADSYRPPMAEVYDPADIPETVKLVLNLITSIANTVVPMIYDFTMARVDIPAKNKRTGRDSIIAALTVWTQSLHMASAWKFWTM